METKKTNTRDYVREHYFFKPNTQIAKELGVSEAVVRKHAQKLGLPPKNVISHKDGHKTPDGEAYKSLFEKKLQEAGFTQDWSHGWVKTKEASIFVKNNQFNPEAFQERIVELVKTFSPIKPLYLPPVKNGHLLIIDAADVHVGKLASVLETDKEYNIAKAVARVMLGVEKILENVKHLQFSEVLLVIGNDVMHTDTPFRKTTAGTPQDTDGMWYEAYVAALEMYISVIEKLRPMGKMTVVYNPSNHDFQSGFFLANSVKSYYHNSEITFHVNMKHRKYFQFGNSLIATSHGDGANERDLVNIMAMEAKKMWSKTKYWHWYLHHVHHMKKLKYRDGEDYNGVTVEYLRAVSPADGWHSKNGYLSNQSMTAFVHSTTGGQVLRLTYNYQ
jgi:hypothetical protein